MTDKATRQEADKTEIIDLFDAAYDALRHLSAEIQILRAAACYNGESLDNEDLEYYCVEMADHADALMKCLHTYEQLTIKKGGAGVK